MGVVSLRGDAARQYLENTLGLSAGDTAPVKSLRVKGLYRKISSIAARFKKEEDEVIQIIRTFTSPPHLSGAYPRCSLDPKHQRAAERLVLAGVLVKTRAKKNVTAYYRFAEGK